MRLLIHYVGDVHQPLHASNRVNTAYPNGDRGGNDFPLPTHYKVKELHAVFDDVFWEYFGHQNTPFNQADWDEQGKNTTMLVKKWKITDEEANDLDAMNWANESFDFVEEFVYKDIKENEALPDWYVKKGIDITERRIVLAGHRLAHLLESLNFDQNLPQNNSL